MIYFISNSFIDDFTQICLIAASVCVVCAVFNSCIIFYCVSMLSKSRLDQSDMGNILLNLIWVSPYLDQLLQAYTLVCWGV